MNMNNNLESIRKLDLLANYSKFLAEELRVKFLYDVSGIKKQIELENSVPEASKPVLTSAFSMANPKPSMEPKSTLKAKNDLISDVDNKTDYLISQNTHNRLEAKKITTAPVGLPSLIDNTGISHFLNVTNNLLPRLTEEGKRKMSDLSFPIDLYKALKLIDDKTNIFELYKNHTHSYGNFVEFTNIFYKLALDKYLSFVKLTEQVDNNGWIRLGDILVEGKIISEADLNKAVMYQKERKAIPNKRMFIGEAMLELNFLDENTLRNALKIQKWFSKLSETSIYLKRNVNTQVNNENSKLFIDKDTFSNILDFIIPVFNLKGQAIIADPLNKELADKLIIIDGISSIESIFNKNRAYFKESKLAFLKFLFRLEFQDLLYYQKNNSVEERQIKIMLGELLISLDLINQEQLEQAFNHRIANPSDAGTYIGEILVKLKSIDIDTLQECLKIQKWCNNVLAKISYENSFVDAIKDVLKDSFNCPVEIGSFKKVAFSKPLENIVCIIFKITGKINGYVYYILDSSFAIGLTKSLMASYGMSSENMDKSVILEISSMITGSSLTKLSNLGLFCETNLPTVEMGKEVVIANGKPISLIPLMNQWGRFVIGIETNE